MEGLNECKAGLACFLDNAIVKLQAMTKFGIPEAQEGNFYLQ